MTIIGLILSLVAILGAAVLFTNAAEIFGDRPNLGAGPVGSILAAGGTALPETMIPIVAILGAVILGGDAAVAGEIGIGAIMGAPFLLSTLALFLVGVCAFGFRSRRRTGTEVAAERDTAVLDVTFFLPCFALAAGAGFFDLSLTAKVIIAVVLLAAHVYYVVRTVRAEGEAEGEPPERLTLWLGGSSAPMWAVVGPTHPDRRGHGGRGPLLRARSGARLRNCRYIGGHRPPDPRSSSYRIAGEVQLDPVDARQRGHAGRRDITGAMVFQSTIPVSIGVLFTSWQLGGLTVLAAAFALLSGVTFLFFLLRKGPLQAFPDRRRLALRSLRSRGDLYDVVVFGNGLVRFCR